MPTPEWINVKSYGAAGDGTRDDTSAIQKAIDAGAGQVVYVPAGTYKLTETLNIRRPVLLLGDGKQASILKMAASKKNGIAVTDTEDVTIRGLQVRDIVNPGSAESHAIILSNVKRAVVAECAVVNSDDTGIRIGFKGNEGCADCRVLYCDIQGVKEGSGIEVMRSDRILLLGNQVSDSHQHGIRIDGTTHTSLIGNRVMASGVSDISLQGYTSGTSDVQYETSGILVTSNQCLGGGDNNISVFNSVHDCIIESNLLEGATIGIYFNDPNGNGNRDIQVQGNRIRQCSTGVYVRGGQARLAIQGNTVADFGIGSESDTAYGIIVDGASANALDISIERNEIVCARTAGPAQGSVRIRNLGSRSSVYVRYNRFMLRNPRLIGGSSIRNDSQPAQVVTRLGTLETNDEIALS